MGADNSRSFSYEISDLDRNRWNVLDLIGVIGKDMIQTHLYIDIDMTWAEEMRQQMSRLGKRVTPTAFLLKCIGIAQKAHPDTRTTVLPFGRSVTFENIVAGFTVERFINSQPALFFGAIDSPDQKSLEEITAELQDHAVKDFKEVLQLRLQSKFTNFPWFLRRLIIWLGMTFPGFRLQCLGATFGLSSLGKFGVKAMVPPCVSTSTFGVGSVEERPVVRDGKVVVRKMMTLSLNFDHRAIDGAPAARFLQDVKTLLEGELSKYIGPQLEEHLNHLQSAALSMQPPSPVIALDVN